MPDNPDRSRKEPIIPFDFRTFLRFSYLAFFRSQGTNYRLTPRRIGWLALFYALFPFVELATWGGFLSDDLFFPEYRQVEVREPVFIIGNLRSSTTFLHRLLTRDRERFTTMRMWEALFAPSITQRRLGKAGVAVDRWLGGGLAKRWAGFERYWQEEHVAHKSSLWAPEEDEYLLFHIWSSLSLWTFSMILEGMAPYARFDVDLSRVEKERIMGFYHRCLQRHLYAHGGNHRYLAKNPYASPKVETLLEWFPDARFIYLVRNPLDVVPSLISLIEHGWHVVGDPLDLEANRQFLRDMARYWYTYPLECLEKRPEETYVVIRFDDLVANVGGTVTDIYRRFGFEVGPAFAQVLRRATRRARRYESQHEYSLAEVGLTQEQIVTEFEDVFDRFQFDRRGACNGPRST